MERIIKFRAWSKKWGMVYPNKVYTIDVINGIIWKKILQTDEVPILMQFTGFKDKNGIEVYEGDILRLDQFYDNWLVEWYCAGFYVRNIHGSPDYYIFDSGIAVSRAICGNKFQNPELLKDVE